MTPYETWKLNKWRPDLRKFTRDFEKKFKIKNKCQFEPGKVYAITYTPDPSIQTDKWHITPVVVSLGSFRDENGYVNLRGINLFYLTTTQCIELLNDVHVYVKKKPGARVVPIVKIHDKYMKVFPWAYKNFVDLRIKTAIEINPDEWGLVPLLHKYLIGNFNAVGLNEDFQNEIKVKPKKLINPKEKKKEIEEEEEDVEIYEDELIKSSGLVDLDSDEDI